MPEIRLFKDNAPDVNVYVNAPTDQSTFADRLEARRKERTNGKMVQLVPNAE